MKIHIPTKQEKEREKVNSTEEPKTEKYVTTSSGVSDDEKGEEKTKNTQNRKININTATQTQLETLPGIGPSTAIKIISYRKEKGKFKTIEAIKEVSGIGDSKFEKIKNYITVGT